MKHNWLKVLALPMIITLVFAGCSGCGSEDSSGNGSRDITHEEGDSIADPIEGAAEFTDEMWTVLDEHLDDYLRSFSENRIDDSFELTHPYMMANDEEKKLAKEEMQQLWDRGVRNHLNSHKLTYVSPLQDIDSFYVALIKWDIDTELRFMENFKGRQENYNAQLKQMYPWCSVEHDSLNNRYNIVGEQHAFTFMTKDEPDFLFISTAFVQSPRIHVMMDRETINALRQYE